MPKDDAFDMAADNSRLSDMILTERKRRQVAEERKRALLEENDMLTKQIADLRARVRELEIALNAPGG